LKLRFEGKTHFAAPNAKNNTLIAFALGGNDNLSNVIDEEQYPGCVDLFVAGAMRTVQSVLNNSPLKSTDRPSGEPLATEWERSLQNYRPRNETGRKGK
jgi:hypothetical protein